VEKIGLDSQLSAELREKGYKEKSRPDFANLRFPNNDKNPLN